MSLAVPKIRLGKPQTIAGTGFAERFHYLTGASGNRYLFSEIAVSELWDFPDAIVVLAGGGDAECPRILWIGTPERENGGHRGNTLRRLQARASRAHIHLLATSPDERRRIIEDLRAA